MRRPECCNRPETKAGWTKAFREGRFCPRCRRCLKCDGCACRTCERCNNKRAPKDLCPRCHNCKENIVKGQKICGHYEPIFASGEFPFRNCQLSPDPANHFVLNPLRRTLGVEIELEEFKGLSQRDCKRIQFHLEHDGSVQGSGQELVTGKLCGDNYIIGMSELAKAIYNEGCVAGPSTGLHVHVDAIDYNTLDLRRAFVLFATIQTKLFDTLVAKERQANQFCPPLKGSKEALHNLIRLTRPDEINKFFYKYLYDVELENMEGLTIKDKQQYLARFKRNIQSYKSKKYMNQARRQSLNFHSWMMRGTLEFRLHEGTTDFNDLLMWPLWCGWFVQCNLGLTDKEVERYIKTPPSIIELSERFAAGKTAMPKNILEWVRKKCEATPTAPQAQQAGTGFAGMIGDVWNIPNAYYVVEEPF